MKICQYIDGASEALGGGSIFILDLNKRLNQTMFSKIVTRKWRQCPCTMSQNLVEVSPAINLLYEHNWRIRNLISFQIQNIKLINYFNKLDADILHVHGETVPILPHTPLPVFHPWMSVRKPVCLTIHALWSLFNNESYIIKSEQKFLNRADHIIVVERFLKEHLEKKFAINPNKISFLPCAFPLNSGKTHNSNLINFPEKKIIFSPQRFSTERNVFITIKAASILLKYRNDVVFVLAGTGPLLEKAKKYSVDLGVESSLVFLGFIEHSEVLSIMEKSYVVVNSTPVPSAGKITLEAFAYKKPVIRARTTDTYPVEDNVTGLLYDSSNSTDLAQKINFLLDNEALAYQFGINGHKIFLENYNFDSIILEHIKIYERLGKR